MSLASDDATSLKHSCCYTPLSFPLSQTQSQERQHCRSSPKQVIGGEKKKTGDDWLMIIEGWVGGGNSAKWEKLLLHSPWYPFILFSAHPPLSVPTKQVNLHKGDGLVIVLMPFLVDDINKLLVLGGVALQWGNGWIAAWSSPDLNSLLLPWSPVGQRPTQGQVHP